jgi:deazaflavin-dependent oxidoreductase (nitroreductase family)
MVQHFDHVTVVVRDLDAAKRFFALLGFDEETAVVIRGDVPTFSTSTAASWSSCAGRRASPSSCRSGGTTGRRGRARASRRACAMAAGAMPSSAAAQAPTRVEALFNRAFGWLVSLGLAPSNFYLLEVKGRKSGRTYTTPVDLLPLDGRLHLVAPRGRTQWVRNAEAAGVVTLRQGRRATAYRLRALADAEKPRVLKAYLDAYSGQVQRFFPVQAGSPVDAFVALADRYPAFELRAHAARTA